MKRHVCRVLILLVAIQASAAEVTIKASKEGDKTTQVFYDNSKIVATVIYNKGKFESIDGKIPDGIVKSYNENNILLWECNYLNNLGNGPVKYYYEDGKIRTLANYVDDKLDGKCTDYYENGKVKAEKYFRNASENGTRKDFYEEGVLSSETYYVNGKAEGKYIRYFMNGKISEEGVYKDGLINGFKKTYYDDGVLEEEAEYVNGKLNGVDKDYYHNGSKKSEVECVDDKINGMTRYFNEDGTPLTEGRIINNDIPDGLHKTYDKGKLVVERTYDKGVKSGLENWYWDGVLETSYTYKNNKKDGVSRMYNKDGYIETIYNNDVMEEVYKQYNSKGLFYGLATGVIIKNKFTGRYVNYSGLGKVESVRNYLNGEQNGSSIEYLKDGTEVEYTYQANKIVGKKFNKVSTIAGLNISNNSYIEAKKSLQNIIAIYLVQSDKCVVVERSRLKDLLKEQAFQKTGCTSNECAVEVGKLLNIRYILVANLTKLVGDKIICLRVINVESSEVVAAEMITYNIDNDFKMSVEKGINSISNKLMNLENEKQMRSIAILADDE